MLPVVLIVTAFIVYGSLYPWQFHAAAQPGNPLLILLHSWSVEFNRFFFRDTAINLVLYLPFGAACYLWLAKRSLLVRTALPLLLALFLSSSIEMLQLYDAQRVTSMVDVVTNLTGAALGILVASQIRPYMKSRPRTTGPLFLLACWVGALLFPFMPDLSSYHLRYKLATFTTANLGPVPFFSLLVMWLAAARLMEQAVHRLAVPLLLFALPLKFFVSGLTLSWTDVLPALLAIGLWQVLPKTLRHRDAALAALTAAAILLTGLAPFHFSPTPQRFSWIPFRALFTTDWESGFAIFFRKSFSYGSAIWFTAAAGLSVPRAALCVATLLATLEAIQLWLPNHVSESTDPLQALLLAWLLSRIATKV